MNHRDDWKAIINMVEATVLEAQKPVFGAGKNQADIRISLAIGALPEAGDLTEAIQDELSSYRDPVLVKMREWPGADCVMSRHRTIRVTQTAQTVLVELSARIR